MVRFALLLPTIVLIGCFFAWPAANLISLSLKPSSAASSPDVTFTLSNYWLLTSEPVYRTTLLRSMRLAIECTAICIAVGYPYAYLLSRAKGLLRAAMLTAAVLPLVLNLLISTFSWMVVLQRKGVINWLLTSLHLLEEPVGFLHTEGAVLVGMTYVVLPLMILPVFSVLLRTDPAFTETARTLGAGPVRAFWHVLLPLSLPGTIVGSLLVYVSSFGLYLVPELLGGPRFTLFPFLIQQQVLMLLNWPLASALSVVLVLAIIPALVAAQWIFWKTVEGDTP